MKNPNRLLKNLFTEFSKTVAVITLLVTNAHGATFSGIVVDVHDGDTLTVKSGATRTKVRLAGIDAPELNQFFGIESRNSLRSLVLHKEVQIEAQKLDRYKRLVSRVFIEQKDINLEQLKSGAAWMYLTHTASLKRRDRTIYINAESTAQLDGLGLWINQDSTPPWVWRKSIIQNGDRSKKNRTAS